MTDGNIAFLDLEYGQIYGSYRGDFVPTEVGLIIYDMARDFPHFGGRKFYTDCELVMRKNRIDGQGKTIGVSETVANLEKKEYQLRYDPGYRLDKLCLMQTRKKSHRSFNLLNGYLSDVLGKYGVNRIVFFGKSEDIRILKKSKIELKKFEIVDIQQDIKDHLNLRDSPSLDKASLVINYRSNGSNVYSKNFKYPVPDIYRNFLKPHKAIGDAARIFLLYKEFYANKDAFLASARALLNPN